MALIGTDLLMTHLARSGGRAVVRAFIRAGLAKRVHPDLNHHPLEQLVRRYGLRPVVAATIRRPEDWYPAHAVSSLWSHPRWIAPYLKVADAPPLPPMDGDETARWQKWSRRFPWSRLFQAMLDPPDSLRVPNEPDSLIWRTLPGMTLYQANIRRHFKRMDGSSPVTHVIALESLQEDAARVCAALNHPPVGIEPYREGIGRWSPALVYHGREGRKVLEAIRDRDRPTYDWWRHHDPSQQ